MFGSLNLKIDVFYCCYVHVHNQIAGYIYPWRRNDILPLKVHDSNGRRNRITDVKDILQRYGYGHILDNQDKNLYRTADENEKYILLFQEAMIDY